MAKIAIIAPVIVENVLTIQVMEQGVGVDVPLLQHYLLMYCLPIIVLACANVAREAQLSVENSLKLLTVELVSRTPVLTERVSLIKAKVAETVSKIADSANGNSYKHLESQNAL